MSIMKILKSRGPRWNTWGTPDKTLKGTEKDSLHLTERVLYRSISSRAIEEAGPAIRNLIAWRPVMVKGKNVVSFIKAGAPKMDGAPKMVEAPIWCLTR